MWNTIEERVQYESIDLLMTKIIFSSSKSFSLIKLTMKSSLVNEKYPYFSTVLIQKKRGSLCLVNSEQVKTRMHHSCNLMISPTLH